MPQKMTLADYVEQRGAKAKALKRGEAEAFGIPYPLQIGWPKRYGSIEITPAMIEDAVARIRVAKREARGRARCGSAGVEEVRAAPRTSAAPDVVAALFPGFAPRQARRYRSRSSTRMDLI